MFDLVQLGLGEGVVEILDGHLVEGDHGPKLFQLSSHKTEEKDRERFENANSLKMFMTYFSN